MKKGLNIVCLFWFIKFIFDMFYMQKIFSITITLFAILLFIFSIKNNKYKFKLVDFLVIMMILLFTFSFFKSMDYYIDYLKVISAFILYLLGRMFYMEDGKIQKTITISLLLVFIVNLIVCILGKGSITWGSASTLKGVYYFKTDYASVLTFFLIFWLFNYYKNRIIRYSILSIDLVLIILTNARIYYMISAIIIIMYFMYKKNKKIISFKTISKIFIVGIVVVFFLQLMSNISFFKERNMISLNINSYEDLFSASNTQGRNVVWETLLNNFQKQNLMTRTFGAGLSFYKEYGYQGFTEHSTYVKVLLNTGYVGLIIFVIFIFYIFVVISKVNNKKLEYITFLLFITFLISGISTPTIMYINTSWLPMFYVGVCISYYNSKLKGDVNEEQGKKNKRQIT